MYNLDDHQSSNDYQFNCCIQLTVQTATEARAACCPIAAGPFPEGKTAGTHI